jgi:hypothetical protein
LRAGGLTCSLDVLHGDLGINTYCNFLFKKIFFSSLKCTVKIFGHQIPVSGSALKPKLIHYTGTGFEVAGCSLYKSGGFKCSLNVFHGGLLIKKSKNLNFFCLKFTILVYQQIPKSGSALKPMRIHSIVQLEPIKLRKQQKKLGHHTLYSLYVP